MRDWRQITQMIIDLFGYDLILMDSASKIFIVFLITVIVWESLEST